MSAVSGGIVCRRCHIRLPVESFQWHKDRRCDAGGFRERTCRACRRGAAPEVPVDRLEALLRAFVESVDARLSVMEQRISDELHVSRKGTHPGTEVIVEWRPDHRRIVDGGVSVRRQRRDIRRMAS